MNFILRFSAIVAAAVATEQALLPNEQKGVTLFTEPGNYYYSPDLKALEAASDPSFMAPITAGTNFLTAGMNAVLAAGTMPLNVLGSIPSKAVSALNGIFGGNLGAGPASPASRRRLHGGKHKGGYMMQQQYYPRATAPIYGAPVYSAPLYTTNYLRPTYVVAPTPTYVLPQYTTSPIYSSTFLAPYSNSVYF